METNGYGSDLRSQKLMTAREIEGLGVAMIGNAAGVQKATPPMDVSIRTLAQNIERLQMAVQNLHSKLEPVLYPEPPSPNVTPGVEARAPRASSNLGAAVNSFADQIEGITDRVNSLFRRCEL